MNKTFDFKAFVYNYHWQFWVIGFTSLLLFIVFPFLIIVSFILTSWKNPGSSLLFNLFQFALISIPLLYFYVFIMHKLFYKKYHFIINQNHISILNHKKNGIFKIQISELKSITTKFKNISDWNQVLMIELSNDNETKIIRSGIKGSRYTQGYKKFEQLKNQIENSLEKENSLYKKDNKQIGKETVLRFTKKYNQ